MIIRFKYELEGKEIFIGWNWAEEIWLDEDDKIVKKITKDQLPDNILIYYSGHNSKISELVDSYESSFKKSLKEANEGDTREFIGVGKEYKSLLLSVILLQPDDSKAKKFILNKLGIKAIDDQVKITLKRPFYARKKGYNIDLVKDETRFWKAKGITLEFLDELNKVKKGKLKDPGRIRDEGYINKDEYEDKFIMYLDIADFQEKFKDTSAQGIFRSFDNLKTIEMLDDISINLELKDGSNLGVDKFSDGQFQSIYIYSVIELFKDRNCITLLDEPDSFLHPEWQFDFLNQMFEITDQQANHNHVMMTSHSAVTLLNSKERKINLFKFRNDRVFNHKVEKGYAISQLSSKLIKVQQDKQILSVIHTVGQDKPILFTEGYSDPVILQQAWTHLYDEEIPFEICFGHGCHYLRLLLQSEKLIGEMGDFPIFGLFDFDMAYNEWNSIRGEAELVEEDPYKGLVKKIKDKNGYAILVPVPKIDEITKQVIKEDKKTYKENSKLELEHLFYSDVTAKYFQKKPIVGGGEIIEISDAQKMKFAREVVPTLDKAQFEVFRPLFEFIKSRMPVMAVKN